MRYTHKQSLQHRMLIPGFIATAMLLTAGFAHAGDIKFGQDKPLDVSEKGALTADGKKAAVKELDNVPGEDAWQAFVWAQLDRGAEGPLYIEFWQDVNGTPSIVHRHEETAYDGKKYLSTEFDLEGNIGFNKNRTYTVKAVQVNAKGKDITLAKSKIKLVKSGRKPAEEESGGDDEGDDASDQDVADSLAGPDEEDEEVGDKSVEPEVEEQGPPEVKPKKGCSVQATDNGWSGPMVLLLAAAGLVRRRRKHAA
ncbi:MAG: MYXO-CTERM sorting domain-containing protein [Nannocystaceae bacterium]